MDGAMQSSSVASIPEGEVESLMTMVADEHGLELDQVVLRSTALTPPYRVNS